MSEVNEILAQLMPAMQTAVKEWTKRNIPNPDTRKTVFKLNEESLELLDAVVLGGDVAGEIGDVLFVLLGIAEQTGVDITEAFWNTVNKNNARTWKHHNGYLKHESE